MNKTLYRVIFNKKRGLRMAVSEGTKSEGKGGGAALRGWAAGIAWPCRSSHALGFLASHAGYFLAASSICAFVRVSVRYGEFVGRRGRS